MKFQNWASFEKHLGETTPGHLAASYLVITPCSFERRKIFAFLLAAIKKKEPTVSLVSLEASQATPESVLSQLHSPSLLGDATLVQVDGVDKWKKGQLEALIPAVQTPSPATYLILGASSGKTVASLYEKGKKEMVALDLSDEKPWDKKTRLQRFVVQRAQQEGKTLSSEAVLFLVDHVGLDLAALEQEMLKLLCYAADHKQISLDCVQQICRREKEENTWQLAEAIVWEKTPVPLPHDLDVSWVLPFIGQVRYQLQIAVQLAALLESGAPSEQISAHFPQIRGALLSKRIHAARERGKRFFQRALHHLYDAELLTKNYAGCPALALELFIAKIHR